MSPSNEGVPQGLSVAGLMLGAFFAKAMQLPVATTDIQLHVRKDGMPNDHFVITTSAGHKIEVAVRLVEAANGDKPSDEGPTPDEIAAALRSLGVNEVNE